MPKEKIKETTKKTSEKISTRIKNRIENGSRDIYGTIIVLAMIVSFEGLNKSPFQMLISIVSALTVIAIAETYVIVQKESFYKKRRLNKIEIWSIIKHELHIILAAEIPIIVFLLYHFHFITLETAFFLAKILGLGTLFCFALVIEKAMNSKWAKAIIRAFLTTLIGFAIVGLKYLTK